MKYRMIIFDVDGTFYDLNDVVEENYRIQLMFYSQSKHLTEEETEKIFVQNEILPYVSINARSATEFFIKDGISAECWRQYREAHYQPEHIRLDKAVDQRVIKRFAENAKLVLLSSNTENIILNTLKHLRISQELFAAIFSSTNNPGVVPFNKFSAMKGIMEWSHCSANDILSIGDRYHTDVEPMLKLGGDGILIDGPMVLSDLCKDLENESIDITGQRGYQFFQT